MRWATDASRPRCGSKMPTWSDTRRSRSGDRPGGRGRRWQRRCRSGAGNRLRPVTFRAASDTVLSGGREAAYFNGLASATTMSGGGVLAVSSGGTARGATVRAGGTLQVFSGGVASGTTLSNYGIQTVSSGGMARGTVVSKGGFQETSLGGTTVGVMVLSGGYQDVGGGPARTTVLLPGGELDLTAAPFTAIGAAVLSPVNDVLTIVEGSGAYHRAALGRLHGRRLPPGRRRPWRHGGDADGRRPRFCRGTRIATPHGEVAVERLRGGRPGADARGCCGAADLDRTWPQPGHGQPTCTRAPSSCARARWRTGCRRATST